jgi:putative transposase
MEILNRYLEKFIFWIHNFILMPNHVHQLLRAETDLSKIMHGINLSYAQYFKHKYNHAGHFWQDRFKSHIVQDDSYLLAVARYIERNPLRAKIVSDPQDYEYSSYNFYAYGKDCGVKITPNPLYLELFGNGADGKKRYRDFINAGLSDNSADEDCYSLDAASPRVNIIGGQFMGDADFAKTIIQTKFNQRIRSKRGRPKKNQQELIPNLL